MYIIDDIAYAGEPAEDIKIVGVQELDDLYLLLTFSTGEKRIFDAASLLKYPVYIPLKNPEVFNRVQIDGSTISWNSGEIDIAPERLYKDSFPYKPPLTV